MVLKDGSMRIVLLCSSLNFALKSPEEQNAIIFQFQNFLNSLEYPIQIQIQSRRIDLSSYLAELEKQRGNITNPLLERQTADYIDFVKQLVQVANVMDKKFFLIIPWSSPNLKPEGFLSKLFPKKGTRFLIDDVRFQTAKAELSQRANVIASGLSSIGIRAVQLTTQELIELYYQAYNPGLAVNEKLLASESMTSSVITTNNP